ncbi:hypothetical protein G6F37_011772 [Rhizopus arrhizus]|nr:hypothetical protein G6F38_011836 [Rhizopus arrhizus]KAG1147512.1 hypothetical protein G6F37_011772 [Rhizopus arrhizus]
MSERKQQSSDGEENQLSKKPRNYKYWSDEEVRKILYWFNLPENEGKLNRNKAQACREVAKELFDGDEYMAISVRSKLMSLEKGYKEVEQLILQLNDTSSSQDKLAIQDKINELCKFHKECKQLFGKSETRFPPITSPVTPETSIMPYSPIRNNTAFPSSSSSPSPVFITESSQTKLPHLDKDRLRALSSNLAPMPKNTSWSLPRVSLSSNNEDEDNHYQSRKRSLDKQSTSSFESTDSTSQVKIARYKAKQASYAAKQAHYEATKAESERGKMESAIQLARIELDRDALAVKKMELELELLKAKRSTA